ncbi:MAG TPA: hypothetical protein VLV78_03550 [Thermoanaerobaculia bacterium]|nr:hypothetical protein [Thermoanaerobaculia bacterium]
MSANTPTPASGGGGVIQPSQPPKDPILVCVLNLLVLGGVGSIIIGQKTKGIIAIVAWAILLVPPSCGTLSAVVAIAMAIDGYLQAQQLQQGKSIGQWTWFQQHM